jgi:predicted NACHT family NTPase
LRQERQGVQSFLKHLQRPRQGQLLVLARRPIFITLMALVNCTPNRMPEGRAILYR